MKKLILFLSFFCTLNTLCLNTFAEDLSSKQLADILPEKIYHLAQKLHTKTEVEKLFGKPGLIKNQKSYFQVGRLKYDLEITYKDENVIEISYTFSGTKPHLKSLGITIDEKNLRPYYVNKTPSHLSLINNKSQEMVVDLADWTIYSLRIRK